MATDIIPASGAVAKSAPLEGELIQSASLLSGFKVLIEGPTGTGKTYSIGTLVDAGVALGFEVAYLQCGNEMETLLGYWTDKGQSVPPNLFWHKVQEPSASWSDMLASANLISQSTNDMLAKVTDPNKAKHNGFINVLKALSSFTDQRTGKNLGPVDKWGPNRILVIDPLTGINSAAMSLVVGSKPIKTLVDWGIAMDQIERLIKQLTDNCKCGFVLISHVERETDQVLGGVKITVGTLGQKLAGKIPPLFSDVILSHREGTSFYWSTSNNQADLKTRNLPLSDKIRPDFRQIADKWRSRGGRFVETVQV